MLKKHYFKDIEITGIPVESDVPEQPVNKEIYEGAKNRVRNLKRYAKENSISADLFLGIESGINDLLGRWMITNIAIIEDNEDKERHNHGGGIQLLTHNEISRIDLTEYAFIMALTKYINREKWR